MRSSRRFRHKARIEARGARRTEEPEKPLPRPAAPPREISAESCPDDSPPECHSEKVAAREPRPSDVRTACYVDFENLFFGARKHNETLCIPKIVRLLNRLSREIAGEGFMKTAVYANWDMILPESRRAQDDWALVGWRTVAVPTREDYWSGRTVKNLVDFVMALDIIEDARDFGWEVFFILSGDNDFAEVAERLKRLRRRVIVLSLKPSLGLRLQEAADEVIVLKWEEITGDEPPPVDTYRTLQKRMQDGRPAKRDRPDEFQALLRAVGEAEKEQGRRPVPWAVVRDEYFLREIAMTPAAADEFVQSLAKAGFVSLVRRSIPGRGAHTYVTIG